LSDWFHAPCETLKSDGLQLQMLLFCAKTIMKVSFSFELALSEKGEEKFMSFGAVPKIHNF